MFARLFCCCKRLGHRFDSFLKDDKLDLRYQLLSDKDMPDLLAYLENRPSITKLDISINDFSAKAIVLFAKNNKYIKEFNIGWARGWDDYPDPHRPPECAKNGINDEALLAISDNKVFTKVILGIRDAGMVKPENFQKVYDIVIRESTEWIKFASLISIAKTNPNDIPLGLISEIADFCGVEPSKRIVNPQLMQTKFFKNEVFKSGSEKQIMATNNLYFL